MSWLLVRVASGPDAGRVAVVPGPVARSGRIVGLLDSRTPVTSDDLRRMEERADGVRDLVVGLWPAASSLGGIGVGGVRRWLCGALLGVSVDPARIVCVMAGDETTAAALALSPMRGWTGWAELVGRARLQGLRVRTMTLAPTIASNGTPDGAMSHARIGVFETLRGLSRLRPGMGLSYRHRSPVYWSLRVYALVQRLLGEGPERVLAPVANLIPAGASVTDLCCGPAGLYTHYLRDKGCRYIGMDFNAHFVTRLRRRGVDARFIELPGGPIATADYVVMCASLYHFRHCEEQLLRHMLAAARRAVIISEPVRNLSSHPSSLLGRLASRFTNPGIGSYGFRHDHSTFRRFAEHHRASDLIIETENPHAIAVFEK